MSSKSNKKFLHPLSSAVREIVSIFTELGFELAEGPEIETTEFNFDRLNVPKDHPARDMQDTFYTKDGRVLRTHTSSVQARYLAEHGAPVQIVVPGRTFRNEATDATHEAQFNQFELLHVDENISLAHLLYVMEEFFKRYFKSEVELRLRPSFFPFVEPGVEVDVRLKGDSVPERLKGKWIEVLGAGMVHPNVLRFAGVDPDKYSGYALGGGVERFVMLKHAIEDIRLFNSADLRFLEQFYVEN